MRRGRFYQPGGTMSELAAKLLDLSAEYAEKKAHTKDWGESETGGRAPEAIAAEYGDTLRAFLNS